MTTAENIIKSINDNRQELIRMIEAAYLSGFEPSSDSLTSDELFEEAEKFLLNIQ